MRQTDVTPPLGDEPPAVSIVLTTLQRILEGMGLRVIELDQLDNGDLRLVYTEADVELNVVGAYLEIHGGNADWRTAVEALVEMTSEWAAVDEALAWRPGTLHATAVEPAIAGPPQRACSWRLEPAWAEQCLTDEWTNETLIERVGETVEGPYLYSPLSE